MRPHAGTTVRRPRLKPRGSSGRTSTSWSKAGWPGATASIACWAAFAGSVSKARCLPARARQSAPCGARSGNEPLVMRLRALAAAALCTLGLVSAHAQSWAWDDGTVPFVVSPEEVVDRMLRIADVGAGDYVIDLGSGDGRIVIGAARRGARAFGIDIDPSLVAKARENAKAAGVADRAEFASQDLFDTDLSKASVVTMYLLPEVNLKLRPRLLTLKPGTRLVSHDWNMREWEPDETIELRTPEKPVGLGGKSRIHLWIVPADARGRW